jgi:hypothetical protein
MLFPILYLDIFEFNFARITKNIVGSDIGFIPASMTEVLSNIRRRKSICSTASSATNHAIRIRGIEGNLFPTANTKSEMRTHIFIGSF